MLQAQGLGCTMNNQVIFEYRVSGFFTDTISTHEKDSMNENAAQKSKQTLWSLSNLFSFQTSSHELEDKASSPWHVSLESSGNLVAFLQV